jgi:hypothetical protein
MMNKLFFSLVLLSGWALAQVHFEPVPPTGKPYTLAIPEIIGLEWLIPGESEVAAFDDSLCVGAARFDSLEGFHIIAWEADAAHSLPGFNPGQPILLRIWHLYQGQWQEMAADFDLLEGDGSFGHGLYSSLRLILPQEPAALASKKALPIQLSLFPNPVNGALTIQYAIAQDGPALVQLFDLQGRELNRFIAGDSHSGEPMKKQFSWTAALPSGIYIVSLTAGNAAVHQKFTIQK